MLAELKNKIINRDRMDDSAIAFITAGLILGLVVIIGGLLFMVYIIEKLMDIAIPLIIIIVGACLAKRFILDSRGKTKEDKQ